MSAVLVTGANGFVGLNVVRRLAERGTPVVALARRAPDHETQRFLGPHASRVSWVEGDVRERDHLASLALDHGVDRVLHSAAVTPTLEMEKTQAQLVLDVNLGGTLNALEVARAVGAKRFVLVSSSGLYGSPPAPEQPLSETVPPFSGSLYTICKVASEGLVRRYRELHGLSALSVRLGTTYGPMERASHSREQMSHVYVLAHLALAGEPARVYGIERLRDFCYADDAAEAMARLLMAEEGQLSHDLYNLATEAYLPIRELLDTLVRLCPGFRWSEAARPEEADLALHPANQTGAAGYVAAAGGRRFCPAP